MKRLTKLTILKNTFWLGLAEVFSRFLRFFLVISAARILGATNYGKFSFATQILFISAILTDLGISPITTRELAKNQAAGKKEISSILSLKTILTLVIWGIVILSSFIFIDDPVVRMILAVLVLDTVFGSFIKFINALFEAHQKMKYEAIGGITRSIIIVSLGLFLLFYYPSLFQYPPVVNLSWVYAIGSILVAFILAIVYQRKIKEKLFLLINPIIWRKILSLSWPVALTVVFASIYHSMDSIMLGFWGMMTENGWYAAAYKIMDVALTPIVWVSASFFPVLSQKFKDVQGKEQQKIFLSHLSVLTILGFPIAIGGIILAPQIIYFVYGASYQPTTLSFQILMGALLFIYLGNTFGQTLLAANYQKYSFWVTAAGAVLNVILNLVLIPIYSFYGAAAATLLTYFFDFCLIVYLTKKLVGLSFWQKDYLIVLVKTILSTAIMGWFIWQLLAVHLNIALIILGGAFSYGVLTILFNYYFLREIWEMRK